MSYLDKNVSELWYEVESRDNCEGKMTCFLYQKRKIDNDEKNDLYSGNYFLPYKTHSILSSFLGIF